MGKEFYIFPHKLYHVWNERGEEICVKSIKHEYLYLISYAALILSEKSRLCWTEAVAEWKIFVSNFDTHISILYEYK